MEKSTVLAALTFVTLVSGMAVAAYQLWITEKAKKEGTGGPLLNRPHGTKPSKDPANAGDAPHGRAVPGETTEIKPTSAPTV